MELQTVSVSNLHAVCADKMATIQGYTKADGEKVNINFRFNVQKRTKGGKWNGDPMHHILVAKPARGGKIWDNGFNGFRTLKKESLVGCILKARGNSYVITE